jgi:hypothetical protein
VAKIVITEHRGVWRVSRRVFGQRRSAAPGLVLATGIWRLLSWPVLLLLALVGLRPWRVEARTVDGRPVVWYVRGTGRARAVAREAVAALVEGRDLDTVLPQVTGGRSAGAAPSERSVPAPAAKTPAVKDPAVKDERDRS